MSIHSTAIIAKGAEVASDVIIGPYCVVGENVKIAKGCNLYSHVVIEGHTTIDENNTFFPFCSVGSAPQDLSYKGEPTRVTIGKGNTFREFFSLNRGTLKQDQVTIIGNNNLFMAYVHIGHDIVIGNNVRIVNACNFAGHVTIHDNAIISGGTNVSQFVTIGRNAFIGGGSAIDRDIPCYTTAYGNRIKLKGINIIGLKRSGLDKQSVTEVVDFYRSMEASALSSKSFVDSAEIRDEYKHNRVVMEMIDFISKSEIGVPPFMS